VPRSRVHHANGAPAHSLLPTLVLPTRERSCVAPSTILACKACSTGFQYNLLREFLKIVLLHLEPSIDNRPKRSVTVASYRNSNKWPLSAAVIPTQSSSIPEDYSRQVDAIYLQLSRSRPTFVSLRCRTFLLIMVPTSDCNES
jgi:hypothetical protein